MQHIVLVMLQIGGSKIKKERQNCDTQKSVHNSVGMGNQEDVK